MYFPVELQSKRAVILEDIHLIFYLTLTDMTSYIYTSAKRLTENKECRFPPLPLMCH